MIYHHVTAQAYHKTTTYECLVNWHHRPINMLTHEHNAGTGHDILFHETFVKELLFRNIFFPFVKQTFHGIK